MNTTLISCRSSEILDAVVIEMTDWTDDFIVRPRALEVVVPNSHIAGVRQFLEARHIVTENNITFYQTEDDE